jgi:hypothetical protein
MKEAKKKKYTGSDKYVVIFIEVVLLIILLWSLGKDLLFREREGGIAASVTRGEKSMTLLYNIMTGIVMFIYTVAIQLSEALKGNKVFIFILNTIALIYLFFFSSWFRNSIFFPLLKRIMTD